MQGRRKVLKKGEGAGEVKSQFFIILEELDEIFTVLNREKTSEIAELYKFLRKRILGNF